MPFLKLLESIRTPFFDGVFSLITYLGAEAALLPVLLTILWCVDKRWGYRLLFMGLMGSAFNQFLKAVFLVPRPWVLDPGFSIVESARAGATGYSLPSGHTQAAAVAFGGIAAWRKKRAVSALCALVIALVGFSRMYLGVHTPVDVLVALVAGIATVLAANLRFDRIKDNARGTMATGLFGLAFALGLLLYVLFAPERAASVAEFDAHGVKSAWTLLGTMAGLITARYLDDRFVRFDVKAPLWAQAGKLIVGIGLVLGIRIALKPLLCALLGEGSSVADAIRYFLITVAGGALWPMTFRFWGRGAALKGAAQAQ